MRRPVVALVSALALVAGAVSYAAHADPPALAAPTGLTAAVATRSVHLGWDAVAFPAGTTDQSVVVIRDGSAVTSIPATSTAYDDAAVTTGQSHTYTVVAHALRGHKSLDSAPSTSATVRLPGYLVGAATADITPDGQINLGGFGLGDGSSPVVNAVSSRGGVAGPSSDPDGNPERIRSRALVVGDGKNTVVIADIETQGVFAAYEAGSYGLRDMAAKAAALTGIPAAHILIASDHTHHGPDTIGAWGGVSEAYLKLVFDRTVSAITAAYEQRQYTDLRAGTSDASDLIYNQGCTEALKPGQDTGLHGSRRLPGAGQGRADARRAGDGAVGGDGRHAAGVRRALDDQHGQRRRRRLAGVPR